MYNQLYWYMDDHAAKLMKGFVSILGLLFEHG